MWVNKINLKDHYPYFTINPPFPYPYNFIYYNNMPGQIILKNINIIVIYFIRYLKSKSLYFYIHIFKK